MKYNRYTCFIIDRWEVATRNLKHRVRVNRYINSYFNSNYNSPYQDYQDWLDSLEHAW